MFFCLRSILHECLHSYLAFFLSACSAFLVFSFVLFSVCLALVFLSPVLARLTVRSTHPRVSLFFSQLLSSFLLLPPSSSSSSQQDSRSSTSSSDFSLPPAGYAAFLTSPSGPFSPGVSSTTAIPTPSSSSSLPPPFPGGAGLLGRFSSSSPTTPPPLAAGGGAAAFPSSSSSSPDQVYVQQQRQQQGGVVGGSLNLVTLSQESSHPPTYWNYPATASGAVSLSKNNNSTGSSFYFA